MSSRSEKTGKGFNFQNEQEGIQENTFAELGLGAGYLVFGSILIQKFSLARPFVSELQNIGEKIWHILKLKKGYSDHENTCIMNLKRHEEYH